MAFASDTFTGTANTELATYNAAWSKQNGYSTDAFLGTTSGTYVHGRDGTNYSCYQHSGTPASADYSVFADFALQSYGAPTGTGPRIGLIARAPAGSSDFYLVLYTHDTTQFRIFKATAGGPGSVLGSGYTYTLTTTPVRVEFRVSGGSTTTLSLHLDGGAAVISTTDSSSPYTAAGKAGIFMREMRETGIGDSASLDNFDAVDAGGGGGGGVSAVPRRAFPRFILNH